MADDTTVSDSAALSEELDDEEVRLSYPRFRLVGRFMLHHTHCANFNRSLPR